MTGRLSNNIARAETIDNIDRNRFHINLLIMCKRRNPRVVS